MKKIFLSLPLLFSPHLALACDGTTFWCRYSMWRDQYYPTILFFEHALIGLCIAAVFVLVVFYAVKACQASNAENNQPK